jgi:hypothetical protein
MGGGSGGFLEFEFGGDAGKLEIRRQKLESKKSKARWRPEGRRYATLRADFSRSSWMRVW